MEDTGAVGNNSSEQHPPPLHPLQEKLQKLAKDNLRNLKNIKWYSYEEKQEVRLFKVDETLRYEMSASRHALEHDEGFQGRGSLTIHCRPGQMSKDVPRDSHIEKYYERFPNGMVEVGDRLSFSFNDALFEPDVLKTHDTLKIWSRGLENEKEVGHDAVFVALGWLVEIHDDSNIAEEDRVLAQTMWCC